MKWNSLVLSLSIGLLVVSCGGESVEEKAAKKEAADNQRYDLSLAQKLEFFVPIKGDAKSDANPLTAEKVALGQKLYFDNRLSKGETQSCNTCHNLATYGVDNLSTSPGDKGENGDRNSPTTLNAALHANQFWDGRAAHVEEQAGMPITNPVEMAIPSEQFLENRLSGIDEYVKMFAAAYPDEEQPITYANLRKAIGAFERKLVTPSRFDDYLKGDKSALTIQEKQGMATFVNVGCTNCHNGIAVGGNMIQKFGVHYPYWEYTKSAHIDNGRMNVSGDSIDQFMFKTPSLRNIEKTSPYFHDGSVASLSEAIRIMGKVQLDVDLTESQVANLEAFLTSMTGEVPQKYQASL